MMFFKRAFISLVVVLANITHVCSKTEYVSALYYSGYSFPNHLPSDIPLSRITHIFYAFAEIDVLNHNIKFNNEMLELSEDIVLNKTMISQDCEEMLVSNTFNDATTTSPETLPWMESYLTNSETMLALPTIENHSQGIIGQLRNMREINPRLKVLLSVGGSDTSKEFRNICADPAKMQQFAANLIENMDAYGFDGIDIDWEFPSTPEDRKLFTELLKLIHVNFTKKYPNQEKRKIITIAIPLDLEVLKFYDFRAIDDYIDHYNLMGYDISGPWSTYSGFHSQLYRDENLRANTLSVDTTIGYLRDFISKSKIILGMPAFGISFNTHKLYDDFTGCANITTNELGKSIDDYEDSCTIDYRNLPPPGYIEVSDTGVGAAYAYIEDEHRKGLIVYDTPEISRLKANYVKTNGLGGGMWWDSKGDPLITNTSRSLVYNFVDELGGIDQLVSKVSAVHFDNSLPKHVVKSTVGINDVRSNSAKKASFGNTMFYYVFSLYLSLLMMV